MRQLRPPDLARSPHRGHGRDARRRAQGHRGTGRARRLRRLVRSVQDDGANPRRLRARASGRGAGAEARHRPQSGDHTSLRHPRYSDAARVPAGPGGGPAGGCDPAPAARGPRRTVGARQVTSGSLSRYEPVEPPERHAGRAQSGIWMCLTFGGLGIWYLYDIIVVAAGDFRDGDGRRVARWEVSDAVTGPNASERRVTDLEDRMLGLESQVGELAERLDFAERLLAQARERGSLPKG